MKKDIPWSMSGAVMAVPGHCLAIICRYASRRSLVSRASRAAMAFAFDFFRLRLSLRGFIVEESVDSSIVSRAFEFPFKAFYATTWTLVAFDFSFAALLAAC